MVKFTLAFGKALRPLQWTKNLLVFLPLVFAAGVAWSPDDPRELPPLFIDLAVVFLAFCAIASAVYLLNDMLDRDADRRHPVKRNRPIASGTVSVPAAVLGAVALAGAGLAALAWLEMAMVWIVAVYLGINLSYSLGVKNLVVLDLLGVASGYVIRVALGAVAIEAAPSPWLYATTAAGALFIVVGRRYSELRTGGDGAGQQRPVLAKYSGPLIGQLLTVSAAAAWLSYTLYAVEAPNLPENDAMLLTVPLVTVGLFRYLYLVNTSEQAEMPERLIIQDLPLLISIAAWVGASAAILWLAD